MRFFILIDDRESVNIIDDRESVNVARNL